MTTLPAFDELNNIRTGLADITADLVAELATSNGERGRKRCEDTIFELLTMGYVYGLTVAGLDLQADIPVDSTRMNERAWEPTAGEDFAERLTAHINAAQAALATETPERVTERLTNELAVVAETETHRTTNEGILDAGEWYEGNTGRRVLKRWETMEDDRVRDPHWVLQGAEVPLDAYFYSDGDKALYPGGFSRADLNVNCRCWTTLVPAE